MLDIFNDDLTKAFQAITCLMREKVVLELLVVELTKLAKAKGATLEEIAETFRMAGVSD